MRFAVVVVSAALAGGWSPETGNQEKNLVQLTKSAGSSESPSWSPDGSKIVFLKTVKGLDQQKPPNVFVVDRDGKNLVQVTDIPMPCQGPRFMPDGKHLVWASQASGEWDIWIGPITGKGAVNLTKGNKMEDKNPVPSPDGKQIAYESRGDEKGQIWTVDAKGGKLRQITPPELDAHQAAWSPDGKRLAFVAVDKNGKHRIWMVEVDSKKTTQLTNVGEMNDFAPVWSPDGKKIAYHTFRKGGSDLALVGSDGSGMELLTDTRDVNERSPQWSPDGTRLAYESEFGGNWDLWVAPVAGGEAKQLTRQTGANTSPCWSPDGKKILFVSTRGGNADLWMMDAP